MSGHLELPEILLTSATGPVSVPPWAKAFPHETCPAAGLRSLERLPAMTIVQAENPAAVLSHRSFLVTLANLHMHQSSARIVFAFRTSPREGTDARVGYFRQILGYFERSSDVELAQGPGGVRLAIEEAMAKMWVEGRNVRQLEKPAPQADDPLAGVRRVIEATASLRSGTGRLDASRTAKAFGLSVSELAGLLGRTRQAISKTADAESLQKLLRPFERVVRLRSVLSEPDFRAWLNLANGHLDGRTPLAVIRSGRANAVAGLVEDMLTGAPS